MLRVTSGISGMLPRLPAAPFAVGSNLAELLHDAAERVRYNREVEVAVTALANTASAHCAFRQVVDYAKDNSNHQGL